MKGFRKVIKIVMPVLAVLMVAGLILSRVYQPEPSRRAPEVRVSAFDAAEHAGSYAEVCGRVASARHVRQIRGEPTFLNLGQPYPDQVFTIVIWGDDRQRWPDPPEERYLTREVCVTGEIRMHDGVPQIRVRTPDQIRSR
ncbi:hypothetical protein QA596_06550 [Balneolales bacterium ANBcel1]|nr:hypothetical protein [Balneolales bacterium ANBcel1]